MKVAVVGSDANAWAAALRLRRAGHEVEVMTGSTSGGVSSLLPGTPLSPEVASEFELGVVLKIVGRVGVSSDQRSVLLKLRQISGEVSARDQERWSGESRRRHHRNASTTCQHARNTSPSAPSRPCPPVRGSR